MRTLAAIITALCLCACSPGGSRPQQQVLAGLIGSEITLPAGLRYEIQDTALGIDLADADYTIVAYLDSAGCTACRMKLPAWTETLGELKAIDGVEVNFVMILNSSKENALTFTIARDNFRHPVCFDPSGLFAKANSLPQGNDYHTLLLDPNGTVLAAGNPATNPKIRALYKRLISGDTDAPQLTAPRLCPEPNASVGIISPGDTVTQHFTLRNDGSRALTIQEITTSCDCTSATISNDTIPAGGNATVTVSWVATDSVAGPASRITNLYFNELEQSQILSINGYIINK